LPSGYAGVQNITSKSITNNDVLVTAKQNEKRRKMRAKKAIMSMFLVLGIVGIFAVNAFAANAWYTCTISKVGGYTADDGAIQVRLTDTKGAFSKVTGSPT
jgi:hypothetical protein